MGGHLSFSPSEWVSGLTDAETSVPWHKKGAALLRRGATRRRRRNDRLSGHRRRLCNLDNERMRDRYRLLAAYEKRANKKMHRMAPGTSELNGSEASLYYTFTTQGIVHFAPGGSKRCSPWDWRRWDTPLLAGSCEKLPER